MRMRSFSRKLLKVYYIEAVKIRLGGSLNPAKSYSIRLQPYQLPKLAAPQCPFPISQPTLTYKNANEPPLKRTFQNLFNRNGRNTSWLLLEPCQVISNLASTLSTAQTHSSTAPSTNQSSALDRKTRMNPPLNRILKIQLNRRRQNTSWQFVNPAKTYRSSALS